MATFGNADQQNTSTNTQTQAPVVSEQGVFAADLFGARGSGNFKYKLAKGATIVNGLSAEGVTAAINAAVGAARAESPASTGTSGGMSLSELIASRLGMNNDAAADTITAGNPLRTQFLLIACVAVVGVVALIVFLRRKG